MIKLNKKLFLIYKKNFIIMKNLKEYITENYKRKEIDIYINNLIDKYNKNLPKGFKLSYVEHYFLEENIPVSQIIYPENYSNFFKNSKIECTFHNYINNKLTVSFNYIFSDEIEKLLKDNNYPIKEYINNDEYHAYLKTFSSEIPIITDNSGTKEKEYHNKILSKLKECFNDMIDILKNCKVYKIYKGNEEDLNEKINKDLSTAKFRIYDTDRKNGYMIIKGPHDFLAKLWVTHNLEFGDDQFDKVENSYEWFFQEKAIKFLTDKIKNKTIDKYIDNFYSSVKYTKS